MRWTSLVPSVEWLRGYRGEWLRPDILAGLTTAAVVIPKAMAYATIAGLPIQVGLYTVLVPMVIYAVLGTSRPLSVSTTTTIAILAAANIAEAAPGGDPAQLIAAGATLAVLVGAMLVVAGVLRLGFIASFISDPVLTGFKSGIGLVIVVDQVPKLLGIHFQKTGFFRDVFAVFRHAHESSLLTLVVAVGVLLVIFAFERLAPKVPAPLVAVAGGIAASALFALGDAGVATVGAVPAGLPSLVLPRLDLLLAMWPGAVGIALMSFTETIAAGRAFSGPGEPRPAPNRELFALGLANVGGGLLGAMPAGGGTSQTAVNRKSGARTQVAELVTAAVALATLLVLSPVIAYMPQAVLAAVVVAYSIELVKPAEFVEILRVRKAEFIWAVVALAGVAVLGTLRGILVAVVVSLVSLAHQVYKPPVYVLGRKPGTNVFRPLSSEHPEDETWPGLLILRTEGRAFFANAQAIGDRFVPLVEAAKPSVVLVDWSAVIDVEYTALKMLWEAEERMRSRGIMLWLAALNPAVLAVVQRSKLGETLGRERMFFTVEKAVEKFERESKSSPAAWADRG